MKKITFIIVLFLIILGFNSCQKFNNDNYFSSVKFDTTFQKVFVTDFTGALSADCWTADNRLKDLISLYGDKIVVLSVHYGNNAIPNETDGYADYRTAAGNGLAESLQVENTPIFTVNNKTLLNTSEMAKAIGKSVKNITPVKIAIESKCDTIEGSLSFSVKVNNKTNPLSQLQLKVYLTENRLVSSQMTTAGIDKNYVHNNVLRMELSGNNTTIDNAEQTYTNTVEFIQISTDARRCNIVAVVTDLAGNVLQADMQPLTIVGGDTPEPPLEFKRKILLEDYTGHMCPNCPAAAEEAKKLQNKYGEQLVVVGVHAGQFAIAKPGLYSAVLFCDESKAYASAFQVESYPSGVINRKKWSTGYLFPTPLTWDQYVSEAINEELQAGIQVKTSYDDATRNLIADVNIFPQVKLSGSYKLMVWITESNIVGPQKNGTEDILDYVHNHVLRGSMTDTWGNVVISSGAEIGSTISKKYTMKMKDNWVVQNCHVIAILTKVTEGQTISEVIQVEEVKIN